MRTRDAFREFAVPIARLLCPKSTGLLEPHVHLIIDYASLCVRSRDDLLFYKL